MFAIRKPDRPFRWPIILLFFLGAAFFVFWPQILGSGVFIGESDRLNSYLNMRLAEYDALLRLGRVPDWDSQMFGGFSLAALHWMNPGRDPIAYLLQHFSRDNVFWALGFTPILLIVAAGVTSFLYIRAVVNAEAAACVGALAYSLSVFSLHRAAQVDNAELTVVLVPLGLLFVRQADRKTLAAPFAGLTLVMTALTFWGFLQEVAYAFLFFGVYALYRAGLLARSNRHSWIPPILVMVAASAVALAFSAPRLITIGHEVGLLRRTTELHYYGYYQILRFFHEGIYGRYFEEGHMLGNGINLSEGLQLVGSPALSLFVCLGIARPRSCIETVGMVLFYALLLVMMPGLGYSLYQRTFGRVFYISVEFYEFSLYSLFLFVVIRYSHNSNGGARIAWTPAQLVPPDPRPADSAFHLFALTGMLFLILIPEGTRAVYNLFARADFTHTRLSLLVLLPLCTLFSIYLAELKTLPIFARIRQKRLTLHVLCLVVIFSSCTAYLISGPFLSWLLPYNVIKLFFFSPNALLPSAVAQVALTVVLLGALSIWITRNNSKDTNTAAVAGVAIAAFVSVEILLYANLRMAGPQTWTYPIPFRGFNYLNVEPSKLRPPGEAKLAAFDTFFETEKFRMVVLSDNSQYTGTNIPHMAHFWRARSIGGYGTGVAERLTKLPWPQGVQTLRTIDFISTRNLDESVFALLAFLNVKYLISLTPAVYFDAPDARSATGKDAHSIAIGGVDYPLKAREIDGIRFDFIENPVDLVPRHFLVEQVLGSADAPIPLKRPYSEAPAPGKLGFLHVFANQTDGLRRKSYAEGLNVGKVTTYDTSGPLQVTYRGDRIDVSVTPSQRERFLVLNQTFNPGWRAYVGTSPLPVLPTNAVMSGVVIPPNEGRIELRFEPFSSSRAASLLMATATVGLFGGFILLLRRQRMHVD